jgi:hypothetical protein
LRPSFGEKVRLSLVALRAWPTKFYRQGQSSDVLSRARSKENELMKQQTLIVLITVATTAFLNANPTPPAEQISRKVEKQQSKSAKTFGTISAASLRTGWSNINGEWVHSDGYKYVKGRVVRTGTNPRPRAPKPPTKVLLESAKAKPTPTPTPNSAAAKAAERERNLRPRPAPQTGSHL